MTTTKKDRPRLQFLGQDKQRIDTLRDRTPWMRGPNMIPTLIRIGLNAAEQDPGALLAALTGSIAEAQDEDPSVAEDKP
jgi:hypothetical protein